MNKTLLALLAVVLVVAGGWYLMSGAQPSSEPQTSSTVPDTTEIEEVPEAIEGQQVSVTIQNGSFSPATLTIKKGTTVTWTNQGSVGHTVTSDAGTELESALLATGESYSHTFAAEGTFAYHCEPHPNMKATVVVE